MCFAPQRRALFRHLNSQKCSECEVLLAFSLANVRVQFLISYLASWLRTRRFSEPTFRPSGATNHWKNTVFHDFPTFSRAWIFFLLRLSLFWSSFFFSSLLWLFPSLLFICPYCRKLDFQTSFDNWKLREMWKTKTTRFQGSQDPAGTLHMHGEGGEVMIPTLPRVGTRKTKWETLWGTAET